MMEKQLALETETIFYNEYHWEITLPTRSVETGPASSFPKDSLTWNQKRGKGGIYHWSSGQVHSTKVCFSMHFLKAFLKALAPLPMTFSRCPHHAGVIVSVYGSSDAKNWLTWKDPHAGEDWRRDDRGWDGWMASLTQWTWAWVNSRRWWWTGRPEVLQASWTEWCIWGFPWWLRW